MARLGLASGAPSSTGAGLAAYAERRIDGRTERSHTRAVRAPTPEAPFVPVFYATTDGQTRRVAERLVTELRGRGLESEAVELTRGLAPPEWDRVAGVALCASVHVGGHQRVARRFAKAHREELSRVPSLFVSVCLAIRSERDEERAAAVRIAEAFATKTGWHPDRTECVAGRLAYTKYGGLVRWIMRRIARAEGGSTDTSRDHEYTDWDQVTALAGDLAERVVGAEIGECAGI